MADAIGGFFAGSIIGKLMLDKTGWNQSVQSVAQDEKKMGGTAERIGKKFDSISQSMQNAGKKMAIAGAAITGALGLIVKKSADVGDRFDDLSQKTGISAETLSSYTLAIKHSDTSLDSLATGLKILSRNIYDTSKGTGEAKDAFKELGISVVDSDGNLRGMNDVMLDVADRFSQMEDGTQKSALALDIFGRSGSDLIQFLNLGKTGLEEYSDRARKLGITMTDETAKAFSDFNDKLSTVQLAGQGFSKQIAIQLSPSLGNLADKLAGVISKVTKWAEEHPGLTKIISLFVAGLGGFLTIGGGVFLMLGSIARAVGSLSTQLPKLLPHLSGIGTLLGKIGLVGATAFVGWQIGRAIGELTGLDKVLQDVWDKTFKFLGVIRETNIEFGDKRAEYAALQMEAIGKATEISGKKIDNFIQAKRILYDQFKATGTVGNEALDGWLKRLPPVKEKVVDLGKGIDNLSQIFTDFGIKSRTELEKELKNAKDALDKLKRSTEKTPGAIKTLEDKIRDLKEQLYGLSTVMIAESFLPAARNMNNILSLMPSSTTYAADGMKKFESSIKDVADRMMVSESTIRDAIWNIQADCLTAMGIIVARIPDISTTTETVTRETKNYFDGLYNDIATGWGNTISNWIEEQKLFHPNFMKLWEALWEDVKKTFFRVIGEMVSEEVIKAFKGLFSNIGKSAISTMADAGKSATKAVTDITTAASGTISGLWTGLGAAVGTFLGSIFAGKGGLGKTEGNWIHESRDKLYDIHNFLIGYFQPNLDVLNAQVNDIKLATWDGIGYWGSMEGILDQIKNFSHDIGWNTYATYRAVENLGFKTAQAGFEGTISKPTLFLAHPGENINIQPAASAGASPVSNVRNIFQFDIRTLDASGFDEIIRRKIVPVLQQLSKGEKYLTHPASVRSY